MSKFWQCFLVLFFIFPLYFLFPKIVFADWPGPRYDFNRTGSVPYQITEKPQEKWVSGNISYFYYPPIVDSEGNIYLGTSIGGITSLDQNGTKKWTTNTPQPKNGAVLDNNNNIYYSTSGYPAKVYSYDQNGNKRWEYSLGGWGGNNVPTGVALSRNKDILYVGIAYPSMTLLALNIDGSFKWQKSLNYTPASTPIVALDGTIYVGIGSTGYLYAISDTGIIKWSRFVGYSDVFSLVLDSANNIYFRSSNEGGGTIVSYDSLGNKRWIYQFYGYARDKEMAIKDNIIYASSENNLIAVNTSGNLIWTFTTPLQGTYSLTSPVVDKDGNIYTSYGNKLYVLNPNGTLKWEIPLTGVLGKPIIADDNLIYIDHRISGTSEGYLHALGKITPDKTPVIFIPGIGGSEFKSTQTFTPGIKECGSVPEYTYHTDEFVWINKTIMAISGCDDYLDILKLKDDGQTPEYSQVILSDTIFQDAYGDLINYLQENGYELNKTLFIFPYDWRKDIALTEPFLNQKIDQIKNQTGSQKVDIVAHSMGGLVAKNYIKDSTQAGKVRKLITLGTPYLGSVKLLKALRYGDYFGPIFLLGLIGINPAETQDIIQNFTGAIELSPSEVYYEFYNNSDVKRQTPFRDDSDIDKNGVTGSLNFTQLKQLLTNFNHNMNLFTNADNFHNQLDKIWQNGTNGVETTIIAGSGKPTLLQIHEQNKIKFHFDTSTGLKINKREEILSNGDDTVPIYSASLVDDSKGLNFAGSATKVYFTNQEHGNLTNRNSGPALQLVKNILEDKSEIPTEVQTYPYNLKGQAVIIQSPVELNIYDSGGNHTGPTSNNNFETNIPGSFYDTLGSSKMIWLPDNGQYDIKLNATDNGSFDLKIRSFEDNINTKTIAYRDVAITTDTKGQINYNTSSLNPPLLEIDKDGNGTIDQTIGADAVLLGDQINDQQPPETSITLTGEINSDGSYKTDVKVELSATDNSAGVAKIEYSLDNGTTVKIYTNFFTLSNNGTTKIKYHSIDNAGNEENPKEKEIIINKPSTSSSSGSDSNNSSSTTTTSSTENNNQTLIRDGVKNIFSNILNFGNEESNNQNLESTNSGVLGATIEIKNNNIIQNILNFLNKNKFIFIPVIILGGFIFCKKL